MLSTQAAPLKVTTDHGFFSKPKGRHRDAPSVATSKVVVNTLVTKRAVVPHTIRTMVGPGASNPPLQQIPSTLRPPPPPSPHSSPPPTAPKPMTQKRKSLTEVRSSDPAPRQVKRPKTVAAGKEKKQSKSKAKFKPTPKASSKPKASSSRGSSCAPELEPIYRSDSQRSCSTSIHTAGVPPFKRDWRTDDDGAPGEKLLSSEDVVKRLMKTYKAYFKNPNDAKDTSFEPHPTDYPVVELEYPNRNARERFILLAPKDVDHYNPIYDLEASLYTVIEFYCTEEQKARFGPIPTDALSENIEHGSDCEDDVPFAESFKEPNLEKATHPPPCYFSDTDLSLLRAFKHALNLEDGPMFLKVMGEINTLLRSFKEAEEGNTLMQAPLNWTETRLPKRVVMRIVEENYQRTVGPNVPKLRQYQAFTSNVYGELMPTLVDEIARLTNLREDSLFLDLGSGVGNICVQTSLQTGCKSFGVEMMSTPAKVAVDVKEQMGIRARMWGLKMGEVELEESDMLRSSRLNSLMPLADVVLVDNKVFSVDLNEALRPKFLDLKEGAVVVSLAPFVSTINARLTDRNVDDISAIFHVEEKHYRSGSVSWGSGRGAYYVHRVDRIGYADIRRRFEEGRARLSRSSRRTRG